MVRTRTFLLALMIVLCSAFANATDYISNLPNGNVTNTSSVSINWAVTAGDSLIATFTSNGGSGSFPNTLTDSAGSVYTLIKDPVNGTPLGVSGFSTAFYVCLYPVSTSIGVSITSPISGGISYSYLNEVFWCNYPGGCAAPGVLPANQHVVSDGNKWQVVTTSGASQAVAMPAYGGTIPASTVSEGMALTNGSSFYFPGSTMTSPISFGGWDFGNDAIWGGGWVINSSLYGTVTGESTQTATAGDKIFMNYAVWHWVPNTPVVTVQPTVNIFIGN